MNSRTCQAAAFVVEEGARLGAGKPRRRPACPRSGLRQPPGRTATASGGVARLALSSPSPPWLPAAALWDPGTVPAQSGARGLRARGGGRDESVETVGCRFQDGPKVRPWGGRPAPRPSAWPAPRRVPSWWVTSTPRAPPRRQCRLPIRLHVGSLVFHAERLRPHPRQA